jgi:peptidoglycan/LPS O-acetylase OafA/YrhL
MVHSAVWGVALEPVGLSSRSQWIAVSGQRGVALFFIVSAFTLFLSRQNRIERRPTVNFFIRRLFRLAPMFYVAVLLAKLLHPVIAGTTGQIATSMLFLNGLSPSGIMHGAIGGWSVADEALFYMTLPLLFRWIRSLRSAMVWLIAGSVIGQIGSRELAHRFPQNSEFVNFLSFPRQLPVFFLGILGFYIWREVISPSRMERAAKKQVSLLLLLVAAIIYNGYLPISDRSLYESSSVGLLLLLSLSVHPWTLLVNPATRFIGRISYSLYLIHFSIFLWLQPILKVHFHTPILRFLLSFFGTLLLTSPLAFLSWKWVEEPGIRLGRKLISRLEGNLPGANASKLIPNLETVRRNSKPDEQF